MHGENKYAFIIIVYIIIALHVHHSISVIYELVQSFFVARKSHYLLARPDVRRVLYIIVACAGQFNSACVYIGTRYILMEKRHKIRVMYTAADTTTSSFFPLLHYREHIMTNGFSYLKYRIIT